MKKRYVIVLASFLGSVWIGMGQGLDYFTSRNASHTGTVLITKLPLSVVNKTFYDPNLLSTAAPAIKVEGNLGTFPEIGNGNTSPQGTNNTLFSTQYIGASQTKSYRIKNIGDSSLEVVSVSIEGLHPDDFTITLHPETPIEPNEFSIFEIQFSPLVSGVRNALVSINTNAPQDNPYTFAIRGTGLCTASALTIYPTHGPVGSVVMINGSDFGNETTALINGKAMPVVVFDSHTIEVLVPDDAATGTITVINDIGCMGNVPFTVINHQIGGCEGTAALPDLFISEVTDATLGGLSYIELYNGTGKTVNLNDYSIAVYSNGSATASSTIQLNPYDLKNNATYVLAIGVAKNPTPSNSCSHHGGHGELANQKSSTSGINKKDNAHDAIRLLKSGGTIVVDQFGVYRDNSWMDATIITGDRGFNFRRLNTATVLPNPNFDLQDWNIIDWIGSGASSCDTNDYSDIGYYDYSGGASPVITRHPTAPSSSCTLMTTLTVSGQSGLAGNIPIYQWFYNAPNTADWMEISPTDPNYSGQQSDTLNILNTLNVEGFQYYVQVRELRNTCYTASQAVRITIDKTVWDGHQWHPKPPDHITIAIIGADYTTTKTTDSFTACALYISPGATLTIADNSYVEVITDVIVDALSPTNFGQIVVETKGAFVQRGDDYQAGTFTLHPMAEASVNKSTDIKQHWYDYTYWSSPVVNETVESVLSMASPNRRFYFNALNFEDTDGDNIDDNGDDWQPASGQMIPGVGYAATSNKSGVFPRVDTTTFYGAFNTGNIDVTIHTNSNPNDNDWNFIGNPYASAIDFKLVYQENPKVIEGVALLWSHASPPLADNPGNAVLNFSQNDYAIISVGSGNLAGGKDEIPLDFIPSGQGFFVIGAELGGLLTFKNAMRQADTSSNIQFFKPDPTVKPNKFWLNLTSDNGVFNQILVAYVDGATNAYDGMAYDVERHLSHGSGAYLYTEIPENPHKFAIQGKASASLSLEEEIPIGFNSSITQPTLYTLSIARLEGPFFDKNTVYLKDDALNITHNLSDSDYSFTSDKGDFNTRFTIVFKDQALSTENTIADQNKLVLVELPNEKLHISMTAPLTMTSIEIIDLLGRTLHHLAGHYTTTIVDLSHLNQAVYLVKIKLSNGRSIIKRRIKKY